MASPSSSLRRRSAIAGTRLVLLVAAAACLAVPAAALGNGCGPLDDALECAALVSFWENSGDKEALGWPVYTDTTVCEWPGVACLETSPHVSALSVNNLLLGGAFFTAEALSDLPHLEVLEAYNNTLSGGLPDAVGGLSHLRVLDVHANALTGAVPAAALVELVGHLEYLDLCANDFEGASAAPAELANVTQACAPVVGDDDDGGHGKGTGGNGDDDDVDDDRAAAVWGIVGGTAFCVAAAFAAAHVRRSRAAERESDGYEQLNGAVDGSQDAYAKLSV